MINITDRIISIKIINPITKLSVDFKGLIDTGASISCIPISVINQLNLHITGYSMIKALTSSFQAPTFLAGIEIDNIIYNLPIIGIDTLDEALIGWDIISQNKIFPKLTETIFEQTISFLKVIPELKKKVVLILGQDTTEIHRLKLIRDTLKSLGYDGIIVKEIADIEIQSVEEKVNMLASLSRFIICENTSTSGHIDELKICSSNRFTTAIIQEKNKGATWMQADYKIDYNFINTFTYSEISKIPKTVKKAVDWAERQLKQRTELLNELYRWRKT